MKRHVDHAAHLKLVVVRLTVLLRMGRAKAALIVERLQNRQRALQRAQSALCTDQPFDDGSRPSTLIPEPTNELTAELRALRSAAERAGGLHAAGGTLGGGADDPKLATLGIVLQSVGLPLDFRAARVAFWLADEGILDAVRNRLAAVSLLRTLGSLASAPLAELVAATDWLPHTTRAALTGLRKRRYARGFCIKRLTDLPTLWSEQWGVIGLQAPAQVRAELR